MLIYDKRFVIITLILSSSFLNMVPKNIINFCWYNFLYKNFLINFLTEIFLIKIY